MTFRIKDFWGGKMGKHRLEKMFNPIRKQDNTPSNTIALTELAPTLGTEAKVGLTAFGGGFTRWY